MKAAASQVFQFLIAPHMGWRRGGEGIWSKPHAIQSEFDGRQLAESYWNARTSCAHRQATAIFAAHSSAASREGSSSTV